ncbi:hypothetical protein [Roseiconus lacunae]|uniref:hypothetical protein n=1 Tax=Roseiconus lacunae TaxID=2605694 RepID=UPI001E345584|nr:hypothetical protein [Roseiconus lacunae]MCD0462163.1 hypothetical protein [Roseiconus lacunae]
MLTTREAATIRAALRYWSEEMAPHGSSLSSAYFDQIVDRPMSPDEIKKLIEQFNAAQLRYLRLGALGTDAESWLLKKSVLPDATDVDRIATVILPAAPGTSGPTTAPS